MADPDAETGGEDETVESFYTEERGENWLDRVRETDLDPEDEDSARLLLNLQDDAAIAVAKILRALEDGRLDAETAREEIDRVGEIVLAAVEFDDEDAAMLVEGAQMSLEPVFYAAEEYVAAGPAEEADAMEYVRAAADAEADEDVDAALGYVVQAGTRVIAGDEIDVAVAEEFEYGLVSEWVNGLDSLESALAEPEEVEES
jgi:hypothetical protein